MSRGFEGAGPSPTVAVCKECGAPVVFHASAASCLDCGTWAQLLNSPSLGLTKTEKKRRKRRW